MATKILITDDHDEFRMTVRSYLEKMDDNFEIMEASSGEAGVLKALRERPDIVLMDIRLPDISGIDAASQIKNDFPSCKIIVLTMFETEAFREVFKSNDIEAYLGKSELYEKLIPTITKVLKEDQPVT